MAPCRCSSWYAKKRPATGGPRGTQRPPSATITRHERGELPRLVHMARWASRRRPVVAKQKGHFNHVTYLAWTARSIQCGLTRRPLLLMRRSTHRSMMSVKLARPPPGAGTHQVLCYDLPSPNQGSFDNVVRLCVLPASSRQTRQSCVSHHALFLCLAGETTPQ